MRRYLSTLLLGVAMCAPVVVMQAKDDDHHTKRYYDRYKKDYHVWNEQEDRAYQHWLQEERRRPVHPWVKANRNEQTEYWRWRHDHSDWR
jgi:hypothetical protein